jgi:hypothetical protein
MLTSIDYQTDNEVMSSTMSGLSKCCPFLMVSLLTLGLVVASVSLQGQATPKIQTGKAAQQLFTYEGKLIHPFCLDFPFDSGRKTPVDLSKCSRQKVDFKKEGEGWLSAEYPREEGDFFISFPPGISYGVLAKKGDRFLVASESSGGGSGQFTSLFWVRLADKEIVLTNDASGGDRCAGRLQSYRIDGASVRFDQSKSTTDILELTGVKLDRSLADKMRYGYIACDGVARYRYALATETVELTSVSFHGVEPSADAPANDPQACFDRLVLQYVKAKKSELKPAALKEFGRKFEANCVP